MKASRPPVSGPPPGYAPVATLGRPHGLQGSVRLHPHDELCLQALLDSVEERTPIWIERFGSTTLDALSPHGNSWRAAFDRIRRREQVESLVHAELYAPLPDSVRIAADEHDDGPALLNLEGLPVIDETGERGIVIAVEGSPMHPLVRVRTAGNDAFVPLTAPYVRVTPDAVEVKEAPEGLWDT